MRRVPSTTNHRQLAPGGRSKRTARWVIPVGVLLSATSMAPPALAAEPTSRLETADTICPAEGPVSSQSLGLITGGTGLFAGATGDMVFTTCSVTDATGAVTSSTVFSIRGTMSSAGVDLDAFVSSPAWTQGATLGAGTMSSAGEDLDALISSPAWTQGATLAAGPGQADPGQAEALPQEVPDGFGVPPLQPVYPPPVW